MAGIVFYFEENDKDVYSGRNVDLDAWNYACKVAGDIDSAIIINKTNMQIKSFDADMDISFFDDIPTLEGSAIYSVCPWDCCYDKISLWDFDHNVDWYVFGPALGWNNLVKNKVGLFIPQAGYGSCHSVHIATCILFHRYKVKRWQ